MKLFRVTSSKVDTVKAVAKIVYKDKSKIYFAVSHGNRGSELYCYYFSIHAKMAKPSKPGEEIELTGSDYFIKPIRDKDGKVKRDKQNNVLYYIGRDATYQEDNELIAFWNIPYTGYNDITFKVEGKCHVLVLGKSGKERGSKTISSPAPVIEIYGDCTLRWEGTRMTDKQQVEQVITYNSFTNNFNIEPIKIKE